MSSITTINGTDVISTSRTTINDNFTALNTNKIETSTLDTDTTLAANSDSKIATQKATKAYVDASVNPTGRSWNEYAVGTSGSDSYAIAPSGVTAYVTGQTFKFKADVANTGACSLNVNGLGAKTIKKDVTTDLATGDILANQLVTVTYDGTNMQLISVLSGTVTTQNLVSSLPTAAFFQKLPTSISTETPSDATGTVGSNTTGSVLYVLEKDNLLRRFARDANTGTYLYTHEVTPAFTADNTASLVVVGSYVYYVLAGSSFIKVNRFDADTLANEVACTVPSVAAIGAVTAWTDGTFIYVIENATPTTCRKWSISGTTLSADSTTTCPTGYQGYGTTMYDGTNIYLMKEVTSTNYTIVKISDPTFVSVTSTTTYLTNAARASYWSSTNAGRFLINIDSTRMYVGSYEVIFNQTAQYTAHIVLLPVTKP